MTTLDCVGVVIPELSFDFLSCMQVIGIRMQELDIHMVATIHMHALLPFDTVLAAPAPACISAALQSVVEPAIDAEIGGRRLTHNRSALLWDDHHLQDRMRHGG